MLISPAELLPKYGPLPEIDGDPFIPLECPHRYEEVIRLETFQGVTQIICEMSKECPIVAQCFLGFTRKKTDENKPVVFLLQTIGDEQEKPTRRPRDLYRAAKAQPPSYNGDRP